MPTVNDASGQPLKITEQGFALVFHSPYQLRHMQVMMETVIQSYLKLILGR